jgi:hypothetical protein
MNWSKPRERRRDLPAKNAKVREIRIQKTRNSEPLRDSAIRTRRCLLPDAGLSLIHSTLSHQPSTILSKNTLPPPNGKESSTPVVFVNHKLTAMLLIVFLPSAAKAT